MSAMIRERAGSSAPMSQAFGDAALIAAALAFETALAQAGAAEGLLDAQDAEAIARACRQAAPDGAAPMDPSALAEAAAHAGTLAIPLVAELRTRVAAIRPQAARALHLGGTSQDLADTALMLQAKAALARVRADLTRTETACAALARAHAATPMLGRTLLQGALPITFGLKAANWAMSLRQASDRLEREAPRTLALQFGGAAGTRAGLQGRGAALSAHMAASLGLADPALPWQARRDGVAALGCALALLTGALGKIARDIALMAQGEVGEAFEPRVPGRGGSSAMAHKRNPTGCQAALTAAYRAPGLAAVLLGVIAGEHERSLGGWQAEAPVLAELFGLAHMALEALAPVLEGLELDPAAMDRNLERAHVGHDAGEAEAMVAAALRPSEEPR